MTLISLEKIVRRFGDLLVLDGAGLVVDEKDRIGVVGDNGTGKTTLIRILAGVDEPDVGSRNTRRNLAIAYGEQIPRLSGEDCVAEYVLRGNGEFGELEARVRELEAQLAAAPEDERLLRRYGELQAAFETGGGYDREHLCEKVLSGIGFDAEARQKSVTVLSGGEKSRLILAALMTQPADLLILDEPTNHLDLPGIEFVEGFIQRYPGAVVVVSHDRRFLDAVTTTTIEVASASTIRFKGSYSAYARQRDDQILAASRAVKSQSEFYEREMDYIRRNMAGRMSSQAKGRLKRLKRLEILQRPKTTRAEMKLNLLGGRGREGQSILEIEDLAAKLPGGRVLFSGVTFRLAHGETIGVLGRNGAGKTTLLNMLAGRLSPAAGTIHQARKTTMGYFSQDMRDLPAHGSVLSTLSVLDPSRNTKDLRDHLALFLFSGDEVDHAVESLSGGEKQRLALARLTFQEFDFVCLDEPTNHLDITAREGLEAALKQYPGAALIVSHDRQFLQEVTDRVVFLEAGRLRVFDGGLSQCIAALTGERQQKRAQAKASAAPQKPVAVANDKGKIRNPIMFEKLEAEIFAMEESMETLRQEMLEPANYSDHSKMQALQAREKELGEKLARAYGAWENWS